jgi:hypothetical protein
MRPYLECWGTKSIFEFIIESVANDVSNVDLSVGLYRGVEELPNVRLLSM